MTAPPKVESKKIVVPPKKQGSPTFHKPAKTSVPRPVPLP